MSEFCEVDPGAEPANMRIGHAERAAALRALDEHFEAGRLDVEEYSDRSAAAAAVRQADVDALFCDLPNLPKPTGAPTPDRRPPRGVRTDRLAALPRVLPVLLVVGLVLLVTVGHNPAGFVALPLVFFLTARFGPHRRL